MNKIARLPILAAACLATAAALNAATTYERSYVEAYSTHDAMPKPISVVTPEIRGDYDSTVVNVRFTVDATGMPKDVRMPSGIDGSLSTALRAALSEWRFSPAMVNGKPVEKAVVLPFRINSN